MNCRHAFSVGMVSGLLCGLAVAFALNVSLEEAAWRSLVLAIAGGGMGYVLACLDEGIRALTKAHGDGNRKQHP